MLTLNRLLQESEQAAHTKLREDMLSVGTVLICFQMAATKEPGSYSALLHCVVQKKEQKYYKCSQQSLWNILSTFMIPDIFGFFSVRKGCKCAC